MLHPASNHTISAEYLSACKAEEGGDVVASLTDDNATDDKIGGAESAITGRMEH